MSHPPTDTPVDITAAVNALVTEDDEPVDNVFSEKQQRLLTEPLYSSWTPPPEEDQPDHPRPFWAAANVGVFPSLHQPPLVPDVFVSLDVSVPDNMFEQSHRSYFFWEFGKAPEVVIEIVSNRKGGELSSKRRDYARIGVTYYVVYDPITAVERYRAVCLCFAEWPLSPAARALPAAGWFGLDLLVGRL